MSRLLVILAVIVLHTGCGMFRTDSTLHNPNTAENAIVASEKKEVYGLGSITCDSIIYNFMSNAVGFYSLIGNKRICLREKGFQGDEIANQIIAQIISPHGTRPFVYEDIVKFRGPIVFEAFLNRAGDHTLISKTCDEINEACGYTSSRIALNGASRLIESIDGKTVGKYIDVESGWTIDEMIDAYDLHTNVYSRMQYRLITNAWEKGLIKLKPYGEE